MVLVFVTSTIDIRENREKVKIDIPGAFCHATNKDYAIMQMNGTLAKLMAKMDPKPEAIQEIPSRQKREESAIPTSTESALQYDEKCVTLLPKLVSELKSMGYVVNPYDPCIANKIVDEHRLTLQWHVDNLMISHVDMSAINDFL